MSQENLQIVRLLQDAFNRRDFDDALQYMDPEIELYPGILPPGEETQFLGHQGVKE